ncbi:MAG: U32 family peptidase [Atopobiaceae bacterium]|nr:U32 family peptidase [Atopobiaceae bacterium]
MPMELLAPAGGPEQLKAAVRFGADAVYLAGPRWGMRARAHNFDDEALGEAVAFAHAQGVAVHLTLNTLMYDKDIDELPAYLRLVDALGVDAAIVADLGALALVRAHAPHVAVHVSTQASVTNAAAAKAYVDMGASRLVLAREMTLPQIGELRRRLGPGVELEVFAHGAMCMAVSGRCLLSSALVGPERSASCGNCTQPCRWTWSLVEETRPNLPLPLEADERGSYLLSANDLCMLEHLDALCEAGVDAIKIEGRNKGAYYVAAVTNAYRHVLDGDDPRVWLGELEATSHRPFSTGFFYGNPTQNPGHAEYARDRLLVAVVERCEPIEGGWLVEVTCRNKAEADDELCVLSPGHPVRRFVLGPVDRLLPEEGWVAAPNLSVNMERYRFVAPFALEAGDMLCV